jgi:acylglycerol lipase
MKEKDIFSITASDGTVLEAAHWKSDKPKAVIALVHGFGDHKDRFAHVAKQFTAKQMDVVAVDMRGHGKSGGKRGDIPSYAQVLEDVEYMIRHCREQFIDLPIFLYGHSWGGAIALRFAMNENRMEISGLIATSPWLRLAFDPPKWKEKLGDLMLNIWPSLTLANELDSNELSHDPKVKESYDTDPLVMHKISPRLFRQTSDNGEWILANANQLKTPVLLVHGEMDKIISFDATKELASKINVKDAEFKALANCKHEPHNEVDSKKIVGYLVDWVEKRL